MIRSGTSLVNVAKAYRESGANNVYAIATHGLFPGDAISKIENGGLINKIICTDSHPRALKFKNSFLNVKSVSKILSKKLKEK